jgi:hypothetical protein
MTITQIETRCPTRVRNALQSGLRARALSIQGSEIESRSPGGASKSGFVIRSCRKFTCPQDRPEISVRHGEARQPKADLAPLLKMRRATKIYQQYAGPTDRTDIPHVRMPVRQSNLGFREDVRPPQLAASFIRPAHQTNRAAEPILTFDFLRPQRLFSILFKFLAKRGEIEEVLRIISFCVSELPKEAY